MLRTIKLHDEHLNCQILICHTMINITLDI